MGIIIELKLNKEQKIKDIIMIKVEISISFFSETLSIISNILTNIAISTKSNIKVIVFIFLEFSIIFIYNSSYL